LSSNWQKQVLASSGYVELGMLEDAELALEQIEPADKNRKEVRGALLNLYMAARKWEMAATVAAEMAKLEPENASWWINLAYSVRRIESIPKAEAILLRAREIHPENAIIAFNLACYACVDGRIEEAKLRLQTAINLEKDILKLAVDDEDLRTLRDWIGGLV
jgi:Flp pilus assembly protein TadD